jgi:IS30 family transposase
LIAQAIRGRSAFCGPVDGAIARALGRAKATISRELQRNALPSGGYSILEREAALRLLVADRLAEGWMPEQISGWLRSGKELRLRAARFERRTKKQPAPYKSRGS